jgi:hypothetical protein
MVLRLAYTKDLHAMADFVCFGPSLAKTRGTLKIQKISCGFIKNARYVPLKLLDNVVKIFRGFKPGPKL